MTPSSLALFALVYFLAVATPGPGIAALLARVFGRGLKGVAPFVAGYAAGDAIWLVVAGAGLTALAKTFAVAFVALKYAGAAYLLYAAWKMATAKTVVDPAAAPASDGWRAFFGALSLTLSNPKVMIFFLSIMPLVIDLRRATPLDLAAIVALSAVVLSTTLAGYALAADRARRVMRSTRAMRFLRRAAGGVMAGVAVAVATR